MNQPLFKNLKVLIIDDQPLAQNSLKRALESLGIKSVKLAENAIYALRLCERMEFDVIICSFNLSRDKDGFHLFEELKSKGHVPLTTAFIFVSAETSAALVNSVVELQPDDFLVKPFSAKELNDRLTRVLNKKQKLQGIYKALDEGKSQHALNLIERSLENPKLASMIPLLMRLKGDILLSTSAYEEAESFYSQLLANHKFTWASVGLAKSLLAQDKEQEAKIILAELQLRPDSRLAALDMLAQYHVNQEDYEAAYQEFHKASSLSPRNIKRHKDVLNLARLLHDYSGQFEAAKNMAKFGKRSIHDTPELYLTVARTGVDLALTLTEEESHTILRQSEKFIDEMRNEFPNNPETREKIAVTQARIHYLKNEQKQAQQLIKSVMDSQSDSNDIEDNIDKAKAFHELGYKEKAVELLSSLETQIEEEPDISTKVLSKLIKQESKERQEIQHSPRELNNMAVQFFQRNQNEPAIQAFSDALRLMPKNPRIALNLLQVLSDQKLRGGLQSHHEEMLEKCKTTLNKLSLDADQTKRFELLTTKLNTQKVDEQA
ncbi:response regulator [Catenovulum sp. SM1970]|uniref:tetratricopeptide repeat-containing response regulator n=1 Tax=Marinifaba aquimaris TaxID=2741323 RepID=UPI001571A60F|nr:response regulator [Marinifaba aquimaris]NTS77003.1 response regulator [Marinifaba aquimaris]